MSIVETIRETITGDDGGTAIRTYECADCGETHESAKDPDRAMCPGCLSNDVYLAETQSA